MEATEYAFPFDSEEYEGEYDREYVADDFARYFRAFISSGIIADGGNIATSLQVVANGDMTTTIKKGNLIVDGYRYELMEDMVFHHRAADGVLDRIDRISITWDAAEREIHAIVREGEYSYKPVAPECRRSSEYMDYIVAEVRITAGSIKITQSNIKDTRLNTDLCGIAFPFWKLDTSPFFAQLDSYYENFVIKCEKILKEFGDRRDLFNKMAQDAYDAYANDLNVYIEEMKTHALEKYNETSKLIDNFYRQITQEGQDLSDEYHKEMDDLAETYKKDAAKQYDKTLKVLTELSNRAEDIYSQFSADVINFYNDIAEKGNKRYEEFDADISAYIEELQTKGDTRLANITQELLIWFTDHQNEFIEWFDNIKNTLTTDQAGKLQAEIEDQSKMIDLILEMLYSGVIMAPITTEEDFQIVDEEGTPIMMDEPICKCTEKAEET